VGFVVDKMTLEHVVLEVLQVFPVSIIPHYFILKYSLYCSILPIDRVLKNDPCSRQKFTPLH